MEPHGVSGGIGGSGTRRASAPSVIGRLWRLGAEWRRRFGRRRRRWPSRGRRQRCGRWYGTARLDGRRRRRRMVVEAVARTVFPAPRLRIGGCQWRSGRHMRQTLVRFGRCSGGSNGDRGIDGGGGGSGARGQARLLVLVAWAVRYRYWNGTACTGGSGAGGGGGGGGGDSNTGSGAGGGGGGNMAEAAEAAESLGPATGGNGGAARRGLSLSRIRQRQPLRQVA